MRLRDLVDAVDTYDQRIRRRSGRIERELAQIASALEPIRVPIQTPDVPVTDPDDGASVAFSYRHLDPEPLLIDGRAWRESPDRWDVFSVAKPQLIAALVSEVKQLRSA